jgi:1-deoxy-D-xylulose-5-phosphate synthase
VLIAAIGSVVHPALEAANELNTRGISAAVLNARFVRPLDTERLIALAERCKVVVTVEEHTGSGGFGGAVLEAFSQAGLTLRTLCLALPDEVIEHGFSVADFGLDAPGIARSVEELLRSE